MRVPGRAMTGEASRGSGCAQPLYGFTGQGEMLQQIDNRVTVNRSRKDAWGIPIAHIRCVPGENELKMLQTEMQVLKELVQANGYAIEFAGSYLGIDDPDHLMAHADWLTRYMFRRSYRTTLGMGASIHECGGARMMLALPADLPRVGGADLDALVDAAGDGGIAIAPDGRGSGTNALVVPVDLPMRFCFGPDSRRLHGEEARRLGVQPSIVVRPGLGFDVDVPADLASLRSEERAL